MEKAKIKEMLVKVSNKLSSVADLETVKKVAEVLK